MNRNIKRNVLLIFKVIEPILLFIIVYRSEILTVLMQNQHFIGAIGKTVKRLTTNKRLSHLSQYWALIANTYYLI